MSVRALPRARPVLASQDELAAALLDWPRVSPVLVGGPFVVGGEAAVEVVGHTELTLHEGAHATARDRATVVARDAAAVVAYDDARVFARGRDVAVLATDHARVVALDASVTVHSHATADAYQSSEVQAWDDALVCACGGCRVAATDRVRVIVRAQQPDCASPIPTEVAAAGQATVAIYHARALVVLHHESRLVRASGDVEVEIYGARPTAERLGPLVRVTRHLRATSQRDELEMLSVVRAQFVPDLDEPFCPGDGDYRKVPELRPIRLRPSRHP